MNRLRWRRRGGWRGLLEETGYEASSVEVVGSTWLAAYATAHRFAVVARGCRRVAEPRPDSEEFVEPVVVSLAELVEHAVGGQLTDQDIALRGLVAAGALTPTATAVRLVGGASAPEVRWRRSRGGRVKHMIQVIPSAVLGGPNFAAACGQGFVEPEECWLDDPDARACTSCVQIVKAAPDPTT